MAIFRKSRRPRPPAREHETDEESRPSTRRLPGLEDRLRSIAADVAAPEDALEPALRAIMDDCGARVGALCLFDQRQGLLRLASEVGLSDEGCRRLRSVRWADPTSWDMPLHGLVNRRAYLIENAAKNRYVPKLVESGMPVRSVACVPLYVGDEPLASLILIALAPRSFGERDIQSLTRPLRQYAQMVAVAKRRGTPVVEPAAIVPAGPLAQLAAITAERDHLLSELQARHTEAERLSSEVAQRIVERDRLRVTLSEAEALAAAHEEEIRRWRAEAERVPQLAATLATAERERAELSATLATLRAAGAEQARRAEDLATARADIERATTALTQDLDRAKRAAHESTLAAERAARDFASERTQMQERLQEAESWAARERERAHDRERELARVSAELRSAGDRERQLETQLVEVTERGVQDRDHELRTALESARAAEAARSLAETALAAVRAELEASGLSARSAGVQSAALQSQVDRLESTLRQAAAERTRLESAVAERDEAERTAREQIARLEQEVTKLRAQHDRLEAGRREMEATSARLSDEYGQAIGERATLQAGIASAESERDQLRNEMAALRAAQSRLEETLQREMDQNAALSTALAQAEAALDGLRQAHANTETESADRAAEIARLEAEREQLLAERAAGVGSVAAQTYVEDEVATRVEVVTVGGRATQSRIALPTGTGNVIAVLDGASAWSGLDIPEHEVVVVPPGPEAGAHLATLSPVRLVVNLATVDALTTMAALRAAGATTRFWGCIADGESGRALPLGMVEPASTPLDPDAIVTVLAGYVTRGGRVITAGADVDALMSLRQALSRQGVAVSMAWDGKQAIDLLAVVRPHVMVIDLELPRRDGFRVLANLGTAMPVPHAVLVGSETEMPTALAAVLADPTHASRLMPLDQLVTQVLAQSEEVPDRRRRSGRGN